MVSFRVSCFSGNLKFGAIRKYTSESGRFRTMALERGLIQIGEIPVPLVLPALFEVLQYSSDLSDLFSYTALYCTIHDAV